MRQATWADIEEFYKDDERRRRSMESDFGVWWRDAAGANWRISFVEATGEIYAIRLGPTTATSMAGGAQMIQAGRPGLEGPVLLLAEGISEAEAEARLEGWADRCGGEGSFDWIYSRARAGA